MNKTDLIARLARKQSHLTKKEIAVAVNCLLRFIQQGITPANRIEIRGFGTFTLHYRISRSRINLKTGQKIVSPACYAMHFKPAKAMRRQVDDN